MSDERVVVVIHPCPPEGEGLMPCCGRTPFEVPIDRITLDPALVTCREAALTGDCEIDCLEGCAYPGEFYECELDALASVAGKDT